MIVVVIVVVIEVEGFVVVIVAVDVVVAVIVFVLVVAVIEDVILDWKNESKREEQRGCCVFPSARGAEGGVSKFRYCLCVC